MTSKWFLLQEQMCVSYITVQQSGIKLSDSGSQIINCFLYVENEKETLLHLFHET